VKSRHLNGTRDAAPSSLEVARMQNAPMEPPLSAPLSRRAEPAMRVLLAEDQTAMRTLLARTLRAAGYQVQEVADGAELLRALAREEDDEPDLIITDLHMPGVDGLEVLARLHLSGWSAPVLVITAFGTPETTLEALRRGAATVLSKPFTLDVFTRLARELATQ
jgi:CheY-like chemotaxis protein